MYITDFSVKNWQFTLIIFVALVAIGVSSLLNMPRGEDPEFTAPNFSIIIIYPGTSPKDMEEIVLDPVEKKLNELDNIQVIRSVADDGLAVLQVEFKYSSDPADKYQEVVREMNSIRANLPSEILEVRILKWSPTDVNIFQVALTSETAPYSEMKDQAEKLRKELEKITSLKNVQSQAYPERVVRVSIRLDKLAFFRIPVSRVMGAIQSENVNIPAGSIEMGTKRLNVNTSGDYSDIEEIRNTIVGTSGTKVVYVKDVANVSFENEEPTYLARLNGKRSIWVSGSQKERENIFKINDQVDSTLSNYAKILPANIRMDKCFDQGASVKKRLSGFATDFTIAILLVLLTLLPLGLRASLVVMVSIPLSLAMGLFMLDMTGFTINQLSIVGMVIALGLLVDDSIVVVENIERYLRLGYPKKKAAMEATRQIGLAVVGCTATLILAFLPLMFLPEASGDFIRSLPAAVTFTVLSSLFVSLTIVPFLSSRVLSSHESPDGNMFLRGLKWLISGSYRQLLNKALHWPKMTLLFALLIFLGCLKLAQEVGISVFPKSEKPQFLINISTPLGTSLQETDRVTHYVEGVVSKIKGLRNYTANVGRGNPRIYYNVIQQNEQNNFAQLFVQLKDATTTEKGVLIDKLREKFAGYPNARIEVKDFEQGPYVEAPVVIRIFGDDMDSLRNLAFRVEDIIRKEPGTIYVNNELTNFKTDLKVIPNKDKAGLLGVPMSEIDRTIRLAISGLNIGKFREADGDEYNINVRLPRDSQPTMKIFDKIYVNSLSGASIPLSQLATVSLQASPNGIKHYNRVRYTTVTAFVKTGYLTTNINKSLMDKLNAFSFPKGYHYEAAGEEESKSKSFGGLGAILVVTIFGILGVLILEFGNFKSTLVVLSVIPLGIIGAVLGLWLTGNNFSFVATVGLIALSGIEVKNSILLVDFTEQLRQRGLSLDDAIQEAGETRFVPIILTTLTAIGGLLPLAIENSPLYSPLAWVIIGGLISSTLLTRIVTPVLYKLLAPKVKIEEA